MGPEARLSPWEVTASLAGNSGCANLITQNSSLFSIRYPYATLYHHFPLTDTQHTSCAVIIPLPQF